MIDKTPCVFISYSWSNENIKNSVIDLANRLVRDGVDVKLDVWDLKDGQDKYEFMEKCVTNSNIDKVLIICDKTYVEKANDRVGGVGNETTIISPKVYKDAKQEKIIPIIFEKDENGEPFLPTYLASRMYKDLTGDNYNDGYESLLRNIYEKPELRKPQLGHRPAWLDEEIPLSLSIAKQNLKNINKKQTGITSNAKAQEFIDSYIESIKVFYCEEFDPEQYKKSFDLMKDYRNTFLDGIRTIKSHHNDFGLFLADTFELMFNTLFNLKTFEPNALDSSDINFDLFRVHIWELFVCTVAYLLHVKDYKSINELLTHTYFLRCYNSSSETRPYSYEKFRFHSNALENIIKPSLNDDLRNKYTLMGYYVCSSQREYLPIYTKETIASADLFLYQVYKGLSIDDSIGRYPWFPTCYVYADEYDSMWRKLKSKKFCERIMPLFGVECLENLIDRLSKCDADYSITYGIGLTHAAPAILNFIDLKEVAILP